MKKDRKKIAHRSKAPTKKQAYSEAPQIVSQVLQLLGYFDSDGKSRPRAEWMTARAIAARTLAGNGLAPAIEPPRTAIRVNGERTAVIRVGWPTAWAYERVTERRGDGELRHFLVLETTGSSFGLHSNHEVNRSTASYELVWAWLDQLDRALREWIAESESKRPPMPHLPPYWGVNGGRPQLWDIGQRLLDRRELSNINYLESEAQELDEKELAKLTVEFEKGWPKGISPAKTKSKPKPRRLYDLLRLGICEECNRLFWRKESRSRHCSRECDNRVSRKKSYSKRRAEELRLLGVPEKQIEARLKTESELRKRKHSTEVAV